MGTPVSSGNQGVLALAASLIDLCGSQRPSADLVLLLDHNNNQPVPFRIGEDSQLIPVVPCRLSPRSRRQDNLAWILAMCLTFRLARCARCQSAIARSTLWVHTLKDCAWVGDIRGGDSFSDIYGMRRFLLGFLVAWTVVLVKGKIIQFPQTFGPYKRPLARWLARYLLRRSAVIIARDRESQRVAQTLVGPEKQVLLSPDVAFCLEHAVPPHIQLDPPLSENNELKLRTPGSALPAPHITGLNINGLMFNGGYDRKNMFGLKLDYAALLPELIAALLMGHPTELWLIPHTYGPPDSVESDPEASRRVRTALPREMQSRVRLVTGEYDCHEVKGVIGQCDFFIGSRMHACIAALSQGIPCVGIAYSMKFVGVFETVGMQDWVVDGRTATNEEATGRVLELYRQRDSVRQTLKKRAEEARVRLKEIFHELFATARLGDETAVPTQRLQAHASPS